ncbi:hypothetical protein GGI25_000526 [Coemansia spiralis]|uniref:J domain-containing protein n=2 Tax=Coemansia TaxID=4863 RepID=A0A9W8KZA2_9FUNG|nr:hypothetical protein EDC05_000354 [Coemansia umbellata]KAJ2625430.1 hypothetical protein GGI26_000570 [Coemansia sp. RSA 1358]KAJ2680553.1 hypothetical protein GGI25_000526 [Coemansia spiralis]
MSSEVWNEEEEEERLRDMEREWNSESRSNVGYYLALNVSRTASTEDIRDAFKRLSRYFHPDRHHDVNKREWAQKQFHIIQRAYEVLSDPKSRAAYDQLGEEGVRMSKAVGYKIQSAKDLQEMFEREARMRRIGEIEQWIQSTSNISVSLETITLTSPLVGMILERSNVPKPRLNNRVKLKSIFMSHSFAANLSDKLTCKVAGRMFSQNGYFSSGNVVGTLKYALDGQSWISFSMPALPPYVPTLKSTHFLSMDTYIITNISQHSLDISTPPSVTTTFGRIMPDNRTTVYLTACTGNQYTFGPLWANSHSRAFDKNELEKSTKHVRDGLRNPSNMSLGLTRTIDTNRKYGMEVSASLRQSSLCAFYEYGLDKHFSISGRAAVVGAGASPTDNPYYSIDGAEDEALTLDKLSIGIQGLSDISASIDVVNEVSSWTKVGWEVGFSLRSGITVNLYLTRLGHRISLPVLLTPLLEIDVALYATAIPLALVFGIHYGVTKVRRRKLIQERLNELKEEQRHELFQQKRRAKEAMRLMADVVERSRKSARSSDGLVIESALYGDLPFGIAAQNTNSLYAALDHAQASRSALSATDEQRACDVTLALHALVNNNQLVIAGGGSKRFLPGFYDPAFGVKKLLFVQYRFKGKLHEVIVKDDQALAIPMKAHSIE